MCKHFSERMGAEEKPPRCKVKSLFEDRPCKRWKLYILHVKLVQLYTLTLFGFSIFSGTHSSNISLLFSKLFPPTYKTEEEHNYSLEVSSPYKRVNFYHFHPYSSRARGWVVATQMCAVPRNYKIKLQIISSMKDRVTTSSSWKLSNHLPWLQTGCA